MSTYIEKLIDPCAGKHGGNEQSQRANRRNLRNRAQQRNEVLQIIRDAGARGVTMKEVAQIMGVERNTVYGRRSELLRMGLVEETGEIRAGAAVLRATEEL